MAKSGLPPPLPPAMAAMSLTSRPALRPRCTRAGTAGHRQGELALGGAHQRLTTALGALSRAFSHMLRRVSAGGAGEVGSGHPDALHLVGILKHAVNAGGSDLALGVPPAPW